MPPVFLQEPGCNQTNLAQEIYQYRQLKNDPGCQYYRGYGRNIRYQVDLVCHLIADAVGTQKMYGEWCDDIISKQDAKNK